MPGALAFIHSTKPSRRSLPDWLVWSCTTRATLPLPPSSSRHVLGRLGGRRLVVGGRGGQRDVAVHAGVEGDHRDVGGLGLLAAVGSAALESSAANPSAAGFLASAWVSSSIWISTSDSDGGPSKVIVTPSFSASALGAGLDCLPELVLEALRHDGDQRLRVGRHRRRSWPRSRRRTTPRADSPPSRRPGDDAAGVGGERPRWLLRWSPGRRLMWCWSNRSPWSRPRGQAQDGDRGYRGNLELATVHGGSISSLVVRRRMRRGWNGRARAGVGRGGDLRRTGADVRSGHALLCGPCRRRRRPGSPGRE